MSPTQYFLILESRFGSGSSRYSSSQGGDSISIRTRGGVSDINIGGGSGIRKTSTVSKTTRSVRFES